MNDPLFVLAPRELPTGKVEWREAERREISWLLRERHYLGPIFRHRYVFAGFVGEVAVACQVWSLPTSRFLPADGTWLELSRWCLTPSAGVNAGSRMHGRFVRWLKQRDPHVTTFVSYSDPSQGHTGALYKACNWEWRPTWHRIQPPPTGNGSWGGDSRQDVKDRWVFILKPDSRRDDLLRLDDHYTEKFERELIVRRVQSVLTKDLLRPEYRGSDNPLAGHCYAASEAVFWKLGGLEAGHSLMNVRHEGVSHWFVRLADGSVIDPTAAQFDTPVPYEDGRPNNGFVVQHGVSKRARAIMERIA